MRTVLLVIALGLSLNLFSQPFIGHKQITFTDPNRSNRSIATEVYYPATSAGDDTPFYTGQFPLIVFGHGFIMSDPDLYKYLWDSLVPQGYICAFPTTEGGFILPPPNHLEFGKDLAFLNDFIKNENTNSSSFFFSHVANTSAIGGHSMGGKGSVIGTKLATDVTAMFNFAAALSNPPVGTAVNTLGDYAVYITVPSLIFSGEKDAVAPPVDNQIPLYDTIASSCKTYINLNGGGHCYFASQAGFGYPTCESGETLGNITLTREQQNAVVISYLKPFLASTLKNDIIAGAYFVAKLITDSGITYKRDCNTSGICIDDISRYISIYPNPANDFLIVNLSSLGNIEGRFIISDITGRMLISNKFSGSTSNKIDISSLPSGIYFLKINAMESEFVKKFVK